MTRYRAILLIGPTGAGKTPLGERLEARGFRGGRCHHFDFGAELRAAAAADGDGLDDAARATVRRALAQGALLTDEEFPIARRIVLRFLRRRRVRRRDWVVLNGLPRHAGQAAGLGDVFDVRLVALLRASAAVVEARIRADAGGDRAGRTDDSAAEIAAKLSVFESRTRPLVEHYESRGSRVVRLDVG